MYCLLIYLLVYFSIIVISLNFFTTFYIPLRPPEKNNEKKNLALILYHHKMASEHEFLFYQWLMEKKLLFYNTPFITLFKNVIKCWTISYSYIFLNYA